MSELNEKDTVDAETVFDVDLVIPPKSNWKVPVSTSS